MPPPPENIHKSQSIIPYDMFQRVLQKQASLNKRLSAVSALSDPEHQPNNHGAAVAAAAAQQRELVTKSHTETAV